jgi:hypothetical protein
MDIYAQYNYENDHEMLMARIERGLGRSITAQEFTNFVEKFNDVVTNFAYGLVDELIDDEELWLDDEVTE